MIYYINNLRRKKKYYILYGNAIELKLRSEYLKHVYFLIGMLFFLCTGSILMYFIRRLCFDMTQCLTLYFFKEKEYLLHDLLYFIETWQIALSYNSFKYILIENKAGYFKFITKMCSKSVNNLVIFIPSFIFICAIIT